MALLILFGRFVETGEHAKLRLRDRRPPRPLALFAPQMLPSLIFQLDEPERRSCCELVARALFLFGAAAT
jgi:hypothetical protein